MGYFFVVGYQVGPQIEPVITIVLAYRRRKDPGSRRKLEVPEPYLPLKALGKIGVQGVPSPKAREYGLVERVPYIDVTIKGRADTGVGVRLQLQTITTKTVGVVDTTNDNPPPGPVAVRYIGYVPCTTRPGT